MMPKPQALRRIVSTRLPTRSGLFQLVGFEREIPGTKQVETALAIILGNVRKASPLMRIHSQCFTGEVLGSLRCDCRDQLDIAMTEIAEERCGLVIYEYQEGRGIGLMAKLQAYALQDMGFDTIEANHALGLTADCRNFHLPVAILHYLNVRSVRLLSNNPEKFRALINGGIEVVEQISCEAPPHPHALPYLRTKKERMGHTLKLL